MPEMQGTIFLAKSQVRRKYKGSWLLKGNLLIAFGKIGRDLNPGPKSQTSENNIPSL